MISPSPMLSISWRDAFSMPAGGWATPARVPDSGGMAW